MKLNIAPTTLILVATFGLSVAATAQTRSTIGDSVGSRRPGK